MYVAPKSTEVQKVWGSYGTTRGTNSTTDGISNTNTLYGFGSTAHPAAYYCKTLATGGYNTWYLPAKKELEMLYTNHTVTPFATANSFSTGVYHWSSTEGGGYAAYARDFYSYGAYGNIGKMNSYYTRAVRRSLV